MVHGLSDRVGERTAAVSKTSRRDVRHRARRENSKDRVRASSILPLVFDTAALQF
jgi:hypothetical protein